MNEWRHRAPFPFICSLKNKTKTKNLEHKKLKVVAMGTTPGEYCLRGGGEVCLSERWSSVIKWCLIILVAIIIITIIAIVVVVVATFTKLRTIDVCLYSHHQYLFRQPIKQFIYLIIWLEGNLFHHHQRWREPLHHHNHHRHLCWHSRPQITWTIFVYLLIWCFQWFFNLIFLPSNFILRTPDSRKHLKIFLYDGMTTTMTLRVTMTLKKLVPSNRMFNSFIYTVLTLMPLPLLLLTTTTTMILLQVVKRRLPKLEIFLMVCTRKGRLTSKPIPRNNLELHHKHNFSVMLTPYAQNI